jgi:signal transduction histidine kinase
MESVTQPEEQLTVLVVDDIEAAREHMAQMVIDIGHQCISVASGADALQCIDSRHIDIVLLDLLMPDIDGFEVAREIRRRVAGKWMPVIVVSSLEGDEHFVRAIAMGAADYMVKPVRPAILRAKIRHYQRILRLQAKTAMLAHRQHAINEHITDAIITIDSDAKVCELNRAARILFEHTRPADLVGCSIEELIGVPVAQLSSTKEFLQRREGQPDVPFGLSASEWSIGAQSYRTIALHDLSESRRVERMKDEFLATVSHELRTPLTSILGAMGLLVVGAAGELPAAALELITVAQRNGVRLSHLIDDLLDLTKLEGNRLSLNIRKASLKALLEEAVVANAGYAQRLGVQLQLETGADAAFAPVDADRFLQVMANLLSNAVKHSPAGAKVAVKLVAEPMGWRIDVVDQGPGIDPEFRKRMFEKFSQADGSDQRSLGGTGLGLYISRMLVERMGGHIDAISQAGQGSVFSVALVGSKPDLANQWMMCIARDRQEQDRLAEWISDLAPAEMVSNIADAQALVQRLGSPGAIVANPQFQGLADEFCKKLSAMSPPDRILLTGDSVDHHFAKRHGLRWLSLSETSRERLRMEIQALLNQALRKKTGGAKNE